MWQSIASDFLNYTLQVHAYKKAVNQNDSDGNYPEFSAKWLAEGILSIIPKKINTNNVLILSVAVHGNETAPLELLNNWSHDIFSGELTVDLPLIFIIGNPAAIIKGKRFLKVNLNRLFNHEIKIKSLNNDKALYEETRAQKIMQTLDEFSIQFATANFIHFDLHTAIRNSKHEKFLVIPFNDNKPSNNKLIRFWSDAGLTAALQANAPASTFSFYTRHRYQALSATVELGKVAALGENDLSKLRLTDLAIRAMIVSGKWPKLDSLPRLKIFQVKQEIIKTSNDFKLNISENLANFTHFEKGFKLAEDTSREYEYIIENNQQVIIFPNSKVPVGQRAALIAQ